MNGKVDPDIIKLIQNVYGGKEYSIDCGTEAAARALREKFYWSRRQSAVSSDPTLEVQSRGIHVHVAGTAITFRKKFLAILD